jgi:peptidoglycan/xylan/chitin deacetylase (PgdA/CDA1 family)
MYHYVRPDAVELPHLAYLRLRDFELQLDHFDRTYGFVSREAFTRWVAGGSAPEGVLLTFDDALRDHVEHVLPALKARGLFGIFYAPSGPIMTGEILDVHKVHLALGKIGGNDVLAWLGANAPDILPPRHMRNGASTTYAKQSSDDSTNFVKHLFNWQLTPEQRRPILDALINHAFLGAAPDWRTHYFDETGLRELVDAGMGVGPHGHAHLVSSRVAAERERQEIETSCAFVDRAGGSRMWGYCYPYGAPEAIAETTKQSVADAGCPFAFAVAARDIRAPLAESDRYALPRHNCSALPHGTASFGAGAPARNPFEPAHAR